jgi:aryl-alcohol dehydrogenase-like predicted oxidoreductase
MSMLATKRLGQSDMHITRVGIGTAPIGSTTDWRIYWGQQDEHDSLRAGELGGIHQAMVRH